MGINFGAAKVFCSSKFVIDSTIVIEFNIYALRRKPYISTDIILYGY